MATSNTMNFGPEWMRRFPKTPTSDNNRSTSPTLSSSNATTNSSTISASANSSINPANGNGTNTFSWSSVAAANSNNTTSSRSLHNEASEKSDVPGAGDSALNPFKYSKDFMLKLYKPVGLPLEFERHEYVTSEEALQPMAMIVLTEQEQKLLSGASVNSELTRRIVSNASSGTVAGNERVERERVPFSPRSEKHISTGLTSPRSERFGGIIGGVLSGRTSPRSSRPPRTSGSLNLSSVDDPMWNGVTRHAVGTFDSNGVFRIPGNNLEDETLDKAKREDIERGKKIEQELEKKNLTDRSDVNTYNKSSQNESKLERKEMNNESVNDIEDSTRNEFMEDLQENTSAQPGLRQETQHERQVQENKVSQDWQESQNQPNKEIEETSLQRDQIEEQQEQTSIPYSQQGCEGEYQLSQKQNYRNSKDDERELEHEIEDDRIIELDREKDQLILEQRRKLQLQQKQDQEQQLVQQRQENEQKQLQLQLLHLQQHQQQLLLLQDQQELLQHQHQHRQQQLLQHHHQQLLLPHHFDPDQDDDVLKEAAFAYSTVGSNTPPLSPTSKTNKYTSAHSIIGTSNTFGDSNSGTASLFSGTGLNTETRKATVEQHKWMYRDPSGNIQGPFSSQEMNEWYKGGFFVHSLLVKRVEDTTFEPLGVLIRKTGDDERPFSAQISGSRPPLTISMPNNSSRLVNDPFQRPWVAPNSPSTAQLFLDHQQRFNPFGGTASVPNTPFDRYQFGSVFGRNDVSNGGWGDLNSTTNNTWGQTEGFTSNNENPSPRIQAPNSPPLFNNNSTTFNVSPPQSYLDHQRVFERQQYMMLQQRQLQQQNQQSYPDTFIRQQHQSYVGMSGPVSAPISNAPTSPFIDALTRATGWPATTTEQQTPSSPWGVLAPGIGVTPSRALQSDEIGYFGLRKDGLQSSHIDKISNRHNERQYEIIQDSSFDSKVNEVVESMTKPIIVDDEVHSKKADEKVMSEEKIESSSSKNIADEISPHFTQNFPQKEESYRSKPSLREIQAEEERRKKQQQQEKEKLASVIQQQTSIVKTPQAPKSNSTAWGNNSPSSPAPWAKDEDHATHKTPSLREIQEMEARKAAERKAVTTQSTAVVSKEESTPSNSSWGIIGPNSSNTSNSSSLSTSPVVTTPAWQSNNSAPKKTLREIQKEEEEAMKRRNRIREMQQQAFLGTNAGTGAAVTNSMGKRYADTVATGSSGPGAKKIGSTSMNNAWTTVASKSSNRVINAVAPQCNIGTSINVLPTKSIGKESTTVWDMDSHKSINGSRSQTQSSKPSEHLKNSNKPTSANLSLSKSSSNTNTNSSSENSTPRPPSEEFLKWCRQVLRGLNDVNVEEFIQMLLTFPLDPPPATIEIIQESVYANSPTLDGRRFADEFIKRRKADANGLPLNSLLNTNTEGKSGKETGTGNSNTKDDHSVSNAGAFKVVTTKKGKKKH